MAETQAFALQDVLRLLKLNNRQLKKWLDSLKIEPSVSGLDSRRRELTQEQFKKLEAAVNKYALNRVPDTADLLKRIERLESEVERLSELLAARPGVARLPMNAGVASKKQSAHLAVEHGAKFGTAEKWDWPAETRESRRAALLYIQSRMLGLQRPLKLLECDDVSCECHELARA